MSEDVLMSMQISFVPSAGEVFTLKDVLNVPPRVCKSVKSAEDDLERLNGLACYSSPD